MEKIILQGIEVRDGTVQMRPTPGESVQGNTVQKDSVQKDNAQKNTVQKNTVQKNIAHKKKALRSRMRKSRMRRSRIRKSTIRRKAMKAIRKDSIRKDLIQRDSAQRGAVPKKMASKSSAQRNPVPKDTVTNAVPKSSDQGSTAPERVYNENSGSRMQVMRLYIDGTTVRLIEPIPDSEPKVSRKVRKNRERSQRISSVYTLFLSAALVICLISCISFLRVKASIAGHRDSIEDLKTQLEELKTDNDSMELLLSSYTDLEYIAQVAIEELGMVYPSDEQIVYYEKTESGYVRQYEDIPTE